jgi:hypothetical protein
MTRSMGRWTLALAVLIGGASAWWAVGRSARADKPASPAVAGGCDAALAREQRKLARTLRRIKRAEQGHREALAEREVALREAKKLTALYEAERKRTERIVERIGSILEELEPSSDDATEARP